MKQIALFKPFVAPGAAEAVARVLESGYLGEGEQVKKFEASLAAWIGPNVAVNSGTSALTLAYDIAGFAGRKVIATPMTCTATLQPLVHLGCEIVWADVDPRTGLIDVADVERLLAEHPDAAGVVAVDYGGMPCDYNNLRWMCDQAGAALVADCAHSFGAYRNGTADYECYSFQAIKHLTTGDGGAFVSRSPERLHEARLKRWFGLDRTQGGFRCEQEITKAGYKMHMNDLAASIGLANMFYVDRNITMHRQNAARYDSEGFGHASQASSCWLFTMLVNDRNRFILEMARRGVQCARVHSRNDVHRIFNAAPRALLGVSEFDARQCSIPVGWWLSEEDVEQVVEAVHASLRVSKGATV